MDKPKYYDEMLPYFPENIDERISEINKELEDLNRLKRNNPVTLEDTEDVSDNYQYNLEWNYAISELRDELKCLEYHKQLS